MATTLGVFRETAPGERRVALVPDLVPEVTHLGLEVLIEPGAGECAWIHDRDYRAAGAQLTRRAELLRRSDVLLGVRPPVVDPVHGMRRGQVLIALLRPVEVPHLVRQWADHGVTTVGLDLVPTGQGGESPMDAEASQARIAGYRAVLLGATRLGSCLPPWGAAQTAFEPVRVLVVGAGDAGLQALDTARRLGARVCAVELRRQERAEAVALGAELLDLPGLRPVADDRALWEVIEHERSALCGGLAEAVRHHDLVLTALALPGRQSPVLLTSAAVAAMRPGSVLVDLATGPLGGNVESAEIEGAEPGTVTLVGDGVTVIGAGELPCQAPTTASRAYANNVLALLAHLTRGGRFTIDLTDPALDAMVVTHGGTVRHEPTWRLLLEMTAVAGLP